MKTPDEKDQIIARLTAENELLRRKIDLLIKLLYGSKSEKIDPAQLQLLLEGLTPGKPRDSSVEETSAPEEAAKAKPANKKTKAENHSRLKGWDTLEVIEETVFPEGYQDQKDQLELIGQDVTEQLDYVPAKVIKRRTIRPKFRNKNDRTQPPLVAPAPAGPLCGGVPTFGLTAHLIVSKYADHLPLYRQQNIFQRLGLHAPRDTLNHWTLGSLELLQPIAKAIHRECLEKNYLQADETPIKELAPGTGKTRTGYVWVFNDPCPGGSVSYRWQKGRSREDLEQALGERVLDWTGIIQCDGYGVYPGYQKDHARDIELGSCMAHIRRGFTRALDAGERRAARVIQLIAYPYQLEESLRDEKAGPALRHAIRASHIAPRLKLIEKYLRKIRPLHLPKSGMGQAITYALNQWSGLEVYLNDGRVELDNNLCENTIRALKVGAKNYLFFGSRRGGELGCVAYTLIENCKRHGLPLHEYLVSAMKALVKHGPAKAPALTPAALAKAKHLTKTA